MKYRYKKRNVPLNFKCRVIFPQSHTVSSSYIVETAFCRRGFTNFYVEDLNKSGLIDCL